MDAAKARPMILDGICQSTDVRVLPDGATLVLQAGKRTLSLKADDLEHYKGERGRRGNKLPRGFQRVDALLVETLN